MNQKELDKQIRYLRNEFSEKYDELHKDYLELRIEFYNFYKEIEKMANNRLEKTSEIKNLLDKCHALLDGKEKKSYYFRLRNVIGRDIVLATIIDQGKHLFDNTIEEFVLAFSGEKILVPPTELKWLKTDVLAVYFIDCLVDEEWLEKDFIDRKIRNVFGINQAGQKRNNYFQKNKNQKKTNHIIVDDLIEKIKDKLKEIRKYIYFVLICTFSILQVNYMIVPGVKKYINFNNYNEEEKKVFKYNLINFNISELHLLIKKNLNVNTNDNWADKEDDPYLFALHNFSQKTNANNEPIKSFKLNADYSTVSAKYKFPTYLWGSVLKGKIDDADGWTQCEAWNGAATGGVGDWPVRR